MLILSVYVEKANEYKRQDTYLVLTFELLQFLVHTNQYLLG